MKRIKSTLGKIIREKRKKMGLTQPQLADKSGVTTSIINDLENGIRSAGSKTINKIAYGLELQEEARFELLLVGLTFSKRDFLIPDFAKYPPEILNFLPYALTRVGIGTDSIEKVDLPKKGENSLSISLKNKTKFSLSIRVSRTS